MGRVKDLQIAEMNKAVIQNITLTFSPECRRVKHYSDIIVAGSRFKSLMLISDRRIYLEPGCSGAIPTGLILVHPEEDLFIFPDRDHLVQDGLIIETHPVRVGQPIFTSIFNMSNESKKIKEGEVYSILSYVGTEVAEWSLV